ncbi:MAG: hypothetical protein HYV52_01420 [Parcubacteria group bacterium]|nr:hypothetical protein [Parcubacteria group bacterium]
MSNKKRLGPVARKIIILLGTGVALSLTRRPDSYFRILKSAIKEWQKINYRSLRESIHRLYRSKLINYQENKDGTVSLVLNREGKKEFLRYNLKTMRIKKPPHWDKLWRVVIFDIPERLRRERNALTFQLKQLGFYPLQKSVFIYPYECKNEIDFVIEFFNLRAYARFLIVKETDIDLDLKNRFHLQ